jgi:hypothetical protein
MNLPLSSMIGCEAESSDFFGWATAAVTEMNNDGKDDFMVSALFEHSLCDLWKKQLSE